MDLRLEQRFPSIASMERVVRRRIPRFAADYMLGGVGQEVGLARNRSALNAITFEPRYIIDAIEPAVGVKVLGREYAAPFGVAPIGLSGIVWPLAAEHMARAAAAHRVPFILSTYATSSLERIAEIAGEYAWLQLYVPNDAQILESMLSRAESAGYPVLIVTVDVPTHTRRERDIASGLSVPPRFNLNTLLQIVARPRWALEMLATGVPRFRNMTQYLPPGASLDVQSKFLSELTHGQIGPELLARIRDRWKGRLLVKGILRAEDARKCRELGMDGVIVSNHGARQLDAARSSVELVGEIRAAIGPEMLMVADGGIRSGLDIARLMASGADFVLLARAFACAAAAVGARGPDHAMNILEAELLQILGQLGCESLDRLPEFLSPSATGAPPST